MAHAEPLTGQHNKVTRLMTCLWGAHMSEHDHGSGLAAFDPAGFMALLLSVETLEQALQHLAQVAVAVVPDGPSCGITVIRDGQPVTAVYAGSIPKAVHDDQYQRGDGPCLEAARTGQVIVVQDLAAETRWNGFPAAAMAGGARGVYAHPLTIGGTMPGALNLYAHEPGLFPPPVQRIAAQFAEPAALLLDGVIHRLSQGEVIAQLHDAIESRTIIGQATGIIMAQRRCGPDKALNVLIKISNDRNIKLREVARMLVEATASGG
jgi:putative methionine-R-sulfoxide reductase with GAF domain